MAEIGNVLGGRYRLVELLGQGGMATIYRARDNQLERDVAVKLLRPEYERDPDFGTRFRQEARAAGSLNHPNIVSVYDYGQDPAGAYIVMELIDGEDLSSMIRRTGALPPRQAARLSADIASALAAAHARGIVHRDVKPGNVLIGRDGRVKVTDFGIARAVADAQLTMPGLTLGSVHYFSPEQARGEPTTAASDVYSLGIVLYELLTGRRPWTGDSAAAIAMARLSGSVPSPSAVRAGIPPALDAIARQAMARDPSQRYRTGAEMAAALEAFLADRAPAPAMVGAAAAGAGGAAAGAFGGAAAAGMAGSNAVDPVSPATIASGVARPNPNRVPYAPDSYASGPERYQGPERYEADRPPRRHVPEQTYEEEPRGTSPWVWISALLALAILAVVGFLVFRLLAGPGKPAIEQITVPSFVNQTYDQANAQATSLGIKVSIASTDPNSDKPANTVLSQDHGVGSKIDKGGTVGLTVALGKQQIPVPTLINRTEADAVQLLLEAGLVRGTVQQVFDATIPLGNVATQNPPPGQSVAKGTPVDYAVSKGPQPTPTPSPTPTPTPRSTPTPTPAPINVGDYRCLTLSDAGTAIENDGFRVGTVVVDESSKAADPAYGPEEHSIVVGQSPAPGSKRAANFRINLTVHKPGVVPDPCASPAP